METTDGKWTFWNRITGEVEIRLPTEDEQNGIFEFNSAVWARRLNDEELKALLCNGTGSVFRNGKRLIPMRMLSKAEIEYLSQPLYFDWTWIGPGLWKESSKK